MSIIQNGSQKAIFRISNANPQKPYLEKRQISDCLKNFSNFVNRTKLSYSTMCFSQRSFWPNGVMDSWTRIWSSNFEPGNFLWEKFDDFCCVVEEKYSGWLCGLADLRFQQDVRTKVISAKLFGVRTSDVVSGTCRTFFEWLYLVSGWCLAPDNLDSF